MSNLILPSTLIQELPYAVSVQLAEMPLEAQREFLDEYTRKSRSVAVSYLLQFFFGAHYLYHNRWFMQVLFWITGGGGGIWWFIDLFRVPKMTQEFNMQLADEILRGIVIRYRLTNQNPKNRIPENRPRQLALPDFNPLDLQPKNLASGFLFDFKLKTWSVENEGQYDWDTQTSERVLTVLNTLDGHNAYLYMTYAGQAELFFCYALNLHSVDPTLENEILANQRPYNIITYNGVPFYRERQKEGMFFDLTRGAPGQRMILWEFFDGLRENVLRIEQIGRNHFRTSIGRVIQSYEITDILPSGEGGGYQSASKPR